MWIKFLHDNNPLKSTTARFRLWALRRRRENRQGSSEKRSEFVLFGWTWHHLAITRDLARLTDVLDARTSKLCPLDRSQEDEKESLRLREGSVRALKYILEGWTVHNEVERRLFFPWLLTRDEASARSISAISFERERLEGKAGRILNGMRTWSRSRTVCSKSCRRELRALSHSLRRLCLESRSLFSTSEMSLVPLIEGVRESEQRALNKKIISDIGPRAARLQIVTFQDAIFGGGKHSTSTPRDKANFNREVPTPVKVLLPFWRRRFLKPVIPYLIP